MITVHIETTIKGEVTIHNGERTRDHNKLKNEQNASSKYVNTTTHNRLAESMTNRYKRMRGSDG